MDSFFGLLMGLVALVATGLNTAWGKVPAQKLGSVQAIVFRNLLLVGLLLLLNIGIGSTFNVSWETILIALGIALVGYLALFFLYKGFRVGKIGVVVPIANSFLVFTVLFSVLLLHESFGWLRWIAIGLIALGIILISVDLKDFKKSVLLNNTQGVWFAFLTCVLWGIFFFALKIPVSSMGPFLTSLSIEAGLLLFALLQLFASGEKWKKPDSESTKFVVLVAVFSFIGSLSYNLGIQVADVSLVSALIAANPLVATLYARFFFREKLSKQQYAATLLLVIGIATLALFK